MRTILLSFDLRADFGVFKKPDVNEGLQLTFNMLHKPALLGILGAIAGLEGYRTKGVFPEYYRQLQALRVGIEPLEGWHERGSFTKTVIKYTNTVGYANADGNLLITEQTLRQPAYRCYLLLNADEPVQQALYERIRAGEAEFLPYLGKNECAAWWDAASVMEYPFRETKPLEAFPVSTIFRTDGWTIQKEKTDTFDKFDLFDFSSKRQNFAYFERLPVDFDEQLVQYRLASFAYTNFELKPTAPLENLLYLPNEHKYAYLF